MESKLLVSIAVGFFMWSFFDLITWLSHSSVAIMLSWMAVYFLEAMIFACSLYFTYVFINKKDVSFKMKFVIFLFLLPFIFLIPTRFGVKNFDAASCEAIQGNFIYYLYFIEVLFSIWIIAILIKKYKRTEKEFKKQIVYFGSGIVFFLVAFSWANIVGNITTSWKITQYGLFGMPVFLSFLAYLIVKFKTFNILK
ncbi:PAS/PAC sensor signal transduction histidine kinase [Candidatus Magnetobacterium bavaricum]|uniref:PAS/PAC sensor signal transduction histidine kinase n=1 Tax=Candidatus Magnetobacterium bavaricum TaxID=29290 RepID=A0A0F3GHT8_9BACT|nr:PAS/PAC sensor signal transduction histidine kinase [Candidatus Magnetobacterium bavaricum]